MTELELLIDFHVDAERQGHGGHADTLRALSFIDIEKNKSLKIADIVCGSGAQTITLAQKKKLKNTGIMNTQRLILHHTITNHHQSVLKAV